jgi:hypothetical protein
MRSACAFLLAIAVLVAACSSAGSSTSNSVPGVDASPGARTGTAVASSAAVALLPGLQSENNGLKAVVLGGGGVPGYAWEIGPLAGLKDLGIDLATADLFVGTSAGSAVSTLITTGTTIETLYRGIGVTRSDSTVFSGPAPGTFYA